MPVALLNKRVAFPSPDSAEEDGLLAIGGDLSVGRLVKAYSLGIFPWFSDDSPILWWSPDPRLVLFPDELRVSRSLRQCMKKGTFSVTINHAFGEVIRACAAAVRAGQSGTWITAEMIAAYTEMHRRGYALSVEAWSDGFLAGGLYGILMGGIFFGESMFSLRSNASKVAFATFVQQMSPSLRLIDCQIQTAHLESLGAREIGRKDFLDLLKEALQPSGPAAGKQIFRP